MAGKGAAALRQFTKCKLRTGGRNSQGRITSFHRGGGAKRLLRNIDLKRNTSGVGIVERIEYDPNRSSKIALVRWIEGATPPLRRGDRRSTAEDPSPASSPNKNPESIKATSDGGKFSLSTLPGVIEQTHFGGIITSAFSAKGSLDGLRGLPRVSVAGAKPSFFASSVKEELSDGEFSLSKIQEWRPDRQIWIHRMKRKAAISWQSIMHHSTQASSSPNLDRGEGLLALLRL